jgi:hypothetical protein
MKTSKKEGLLRPFSPWQIGHTTPSWGQSSHLECSSFLSAHEQIFPPVRLTYPWKRVTCARWPFPSRHRWPLHHPNRSQHLSPRKRTPLHHVKRAVWNCFQWISTTRKQNKNSQKKGVFISSFEYSLLQLIKLTDGQTCRKYLMKQYGLG